MTVIRVTSETAPEGHRVYFTPRLSGVSPSLMADATDVPGEVDLEYLPGPGFYQVTVLPPGASRASEVFAVRVPESGIYDLDSLERMSLVDAQQGGFTLGRRIEDIETGLVSVGDRLGPVETGLFEVEQQAHRNEQALWTVEDILYGDSDPMAEWQPLADLRADWEQVAPVQVRYVLGEYRFQGIVLGGPAHLGNLPEGMPRPQGVSRYKTVTVINGADLMGVTMSVHSNGIVSLGGASYPSGISRNSANFAWGNAPISLDGVIIPR
ncbi:hypothetical protein [Nesterenkonia rhizosphaerae]|uniref:Minor tail protein n=1 Tax=Nesterenkonia rhizosphaerae TaxID=1348272 RepID=A0ABP9G050_9MICC